MRFAIGLTAVLLGGFAAAGDTKPAKPTGTWVRENEGFEIKIEFAKDDTLMVILTAGDNGLTVTSKYTIDADGRLKATITDVEKKNDFPALPKKGDEFSLRLKVDGDKATVSDFKGHEGDDNEGARKMMEGEYKKK
jgi:hypothetical protein